MRRKLVALLLFVGACNTSVCLRKSDCPSRADAGTALADAAPDAVDAAADAMPDAAPDGGP